MIAASVCITYGFEAFESPKTWMLNDAMRICRTTLLRQHLRLATVAHGRVANGRQPAAVGRADRSLRCSSGSPAGRP